jgi:hypothetical protein
MAFTSNQLVVNNIPTQNNQPTSDINQLNAQELVFLLDTIRKSSFLGEHIEFAYNTVVKLQNQYLQQTK